ncbi:MAG: Acyl-CoA reductase [uncultured bacterium]|nr:MAG: Acyl-CoA reductase [uncultured bacterium]
MFAGRLLNALEKLEKKMPPASLSGVDNFSRRSFIDAANFEKGVAEIYETRSGRSAVIDIKPAKFPLSPLNRVLFLARYENYSEVLDILKPVSGYLQNASLSVRPDDENFWFGALCGLNVSRICRAGEMPAPTMMWRHDGIGALIEMTKFCDIEKY